MAAPAPKRARGKTEITQQLVNLVVQQDYANFRFSGRDLLKNKKLFAPLASTLTKEERAAIGKSRSDKVTSALRELVKPEGSLRKTDDGYYCLKDAPDPPPREKLGAKQNSCILACRSCASVYPP